MSSTAQIASHARDLRKAAGIGLDEAAKRTGFSKTTIWNFEAGRTVSASVRLINALAACYSVPASELMNGTGKPRMASETMDALAALNEAIESAYRRGVKDGIALKAET